MAILRVVLKQSFRSQEIRNVLHFNAPGIGPDDAQDIVDFVRSNWVASNLHTYQANEWSLYGCDVADAESAGNSVLYSFTGGNLVGSQVTVAALANQVAGLISFAANVSTGPIRGRMYIGGIHQQTLGNDGLIQAVTVDAMTDLGEGFMKDVMEPVVGAWLLIARRGPGGLVTAYNDVAAATGNANPATQRRRRLGAGA